MIIPASSRPRASTPVPRVAIRLLVWSSRPVSRAAAAKAAPSTPISASDSRVPNTAVEVRADGPWVRYSTTNMIRQEPTTATASGSWPARIAGRTNTSSTTKLSPSATSAASPRQRPSSSTAAAKATASQSSGRPALEVDDLVGARVGRVTARPAEHHPVADRELRRARLDRDDLDEVPARQTDRRPSGPRARRTADGTVARAAFGRRRLADLGLHRLLRRQRRGRARAAGPQQDHPTERWPARRAPAAPRSAGGPDVRPAGAGPCPWPCPWPADPGPRAGRSPNRAPPNRPSRCRAPVSARCMGRGRTGVGPAATWRGRGEAGESQPARGRVSRRPPVSVLRAPPVAEVMGCSVTGGSAAAEPAVGTSSRSRCRSAVIIGEPGSPSCRGGRHAPPAAVAPHPGGPVAAGAPGAACRARPTSG